MPVKSWKLGGTNSPDFPVDFEVIKRATLQKTDLNANNNKYYGIELHKSGDLLRVFTHYGRTDDLTKDSNAGVKECRYFTNRIEAEKEYNRLYKSKTGDRKGYTEISLASSNIGSHKAKGMSSGYVDEKTVEKTVNKDISKSRPITDVCPSDIRNLIALIYDEATTALTHTVQAKITAKGIETPLGVLTVGQIEKGEAVLKLIFEAINSAVQEKELEKLSSLFYTAIPHNLGRTKEAVKTATIDNKVKISEKEETLQLMRDMLSVDGEMHNVLVQDDLGIKYKALGAKIEACIQGSEEELQWKNFVQNSLVKKTPLKVKAVYKVQRPGEKEVFKESIGNIKSLFHGSRIKNWVGLLTRGTLMPKLVTAMGIGRTDGGWLGNGIYFGDAACTSVYYTSPGKNGHRLMSIHSVALGKMKDFRVITYGINEAPPGFNSCHGVRGSQFADTELCIYDAAQQHMNYLIEFI